MSYLGITLYIAWGLGQAALLVLVAVLFRNGNHRQYPFFTAYCLANLGQAALFLIGLQYWGQYWRDYSSMASKITWGAIGVTLIARILAIAELSRRVLGEYRGVWGLAWRSITAGAAVVACYAFAVSRWRWYSALIKADRGMELAVTAVIVVLFAFCRYYRLPVSKPDRLVGMGFFLYSCTVVISHTLLEKYFLQYREFWNITIVVMFFVSVILWTGALWSTVPRAAAQKVMFSREFYGILSPEINARLRVMDEHLSSFWKSEGRRT